MGAVSSSCSGGSHRIADEQIDLAAVIAEGADSSGSESETDAAMSASESEAERGMDVEAAPMRVSGHKRSAPEPEKAPPAKLARTAHDRQRWGILENTPDHDLAILRAHLLQRGLWVRLYKMPAHFNQVTLAEVKLRYGVTDWKGKQLIQKAREGAEPKLYR